MRSCCQAVSCCQPSVNAVLNSVESTPTPTTPTPTPTPPTPTPLDNNIGLGSDKKDQTKEHLWHLQSLCPQWKTDWAIILHSVTVNELYFCIQLVKHYYDQYDWVRRWLWLRFKERDCQKIPTIQPRPFSTTPMPYNKDQQGSAQRPKNPGGMVALPSGRFLRVWKVFACNPWNCTGKFSDRLENFQIVWTFSGWSGKFPR